MDKEKRDNAVHEAVMILGTVHKFKGFEISCLRSAEWHYEEENDAHYIVDMLIDLRCEIDNMINALKED